jgi:CRP/FNR family transcriptional regulator, cyclic AMP receptor protein
MLLRRRSDKVDLLKKVPLFEDLSKRHLDFIAKHGDEVTSEPGEVLVRQGEAGREFVFIVRGSARVEQDGKIISHLEAGDFFGEMSLLDGKPRSATVITETPSTLLVVHSRSFDLLLNTVPGLSRKLLMTLAGRLRAREESLLS